MAQPNLDEVWKMFINLFSPATKDVYIYIYVSIYIYIFQKNGVSICYLFSWGVKGQIKYTRFKNNTGK